MLRVLGQMASISELIERAEKYTLYDSIDSDVIQSYLEYSLASLIFYALKEGACSEQSSRMTAMDNSSKNAGRSRMWIDAGFFVYIFYQVCLTNQVSGYINYKKIIKNKRSIYLLHANLLAVSSQEVNQLMPNRFNCTYVLVLVLRSNRPKKKTRTSLTHTFPKHTIVSIETSYFLYKLSH